MIITVSLVVKKNDAILIKQIAIQDPTDNEVFLTLLVPLEHRKRLLAIEMAGISENFLTKWCFKEGENFRKIDLVSYSWTSLNLFESIFQASKCWSLTKVNSLHEFVSGTTNLSSSYLFFS